MLSIGYGDISPMNNTEILVVMFCMIGGIVFFGILLGSISEAITARTPPHHCQCHYFMCLAMIVLIYT